ncbi:hypothetical protein [Salipaludibacillus aurantiacus]|uniref:Uncharacterized protein n=1 Tax=Salipaludibacillus aurantiacus TaxID=1601833 RepID=A0A1H9UZG2_9BACI|nr:hypothetical protein [Salipaludibacillus aurantiacus]SES14729.1 hypothetical protein SAMN05518684_10919 [Salipaludibacillus aurantiacus]
MNYLIDHKQKLIHRTTFANDKCRFHETQVEKREFTHNAGYLEKLISEDGYEECRHCHLKAVKPEFID